MTTSVECITLNHQLNITFHFIGQTREVAMSRERLPLIGSYRSKTTGETLKTLSHLSKRNFVCGFKQINYCLFEFFLTPQPIAKNVVGIRRPPPILIRGLIPAFSWILLWHPGGAGHSSNPPLLQFLCHLLHPHLLRLDPHRLVPLIMVDLSQTKKVPLQVLDLMMRFRMGQLLRKRTVCL